FDSLGHKFVHVLDVTLEVPVPRRAPRAHRTERAHAAVLLETLTLVEDDLAGTFVGTGEQRAGHDRVRAGGDRLRNVSGGGHAAGGDRRDVWGPGRRRA